MDSEVFAAQCCMMTRVAKEIVMTTNKLSSGMKAKVEAELTLGRESFRSMAISRTPQCRSLLAKILAQIQAGTVNMEAQQQPAWITGWNEFAEAVAQVETDTTTTPAKLNEGMDEAALWSTGWFAVQAYVVHVVEGKDTAATEEGKDEG